MNMQKSVCLGAVLAILVAASGEGQNLADVAKKEKQRQVKQRSRNGEAKVYTDTQGAAASPAPQTDRTSDGDAAAAPAPPDASSPGPVGQPRPQPVPSEVASARSYRSVSVTMYVTSWCPYCRRAREFLARQPNVRVDVHDIEASQARHKEMLAKTGGVGGVPVIDVEGIILSGYSAPAITEALARTRARGR